MSCSGKATPSAAAISRTFSKAGSPTSTCAPEVQARIEHALAGQDHYDYVVNGRFKGGYITRHYGDPANGIDAVQLETSQRTYMDEDTYAYDTRKAAGAERVIRSLVEAALD